MGYNILTPSSGMMINMLNNSVPKASTGDTLQLFKNYDFTHGKWAAYLVIVAGDRMDTHPKFAGRTCWKTTGQAGLPEIEQSWKFKIANYADMATVNSSFYPMRDGIIIFDSGIVVDVYNQGFRWKDMAGCRQPMKVPLSIFAQSSKENGCRL